MPPDIRGGIALLRKVQADLFSHGHGDEIITRSSIDLERTGRAIIDRDRDERCLLGDLQRNGIAIKPLQQPHYTFTLDRSFLCGTKVNSYHRSNSALYGNGK